MTAILRRFRHLPKLCAVLLSVIIMGLAGASARAEKRVALVMGNSAYQKANLLSNPVNDAEAISAVFRNASFDVVDLKRDLKASEMRRVLRDFSYSVRDADIAIVYFAGHGIEIDGSNYLIPVDAVLERDIDAYDEAIPLDRILTVIEPAKRLRLVILDACRDNPFNTAMRRTVGSRDVGRGLAKVEPASPNTLIAYAAKAGSVAADGDIRNSPFTAALVKYLARPGLDLRKAFGFARDDVLKATNNKQEPFVYGSLGGDDVPLVSGAPPIAPGAPMGAAVTSPADVESEIRRTYELALEVGTVEVWDSFISNYPNGFYADLAKAQRRKLAAEEARLAATEKAKAALDVQARRAVEAAKAAQQAKADEQAKAAEQARVAAERRKALEEAKVAEAERAKVAAQAKAEDEARIAAEKAAAKAKAAEDARSAQQARAAAEKKAREDAIAAEGRAKAAEQARVAAERRKALEEAKVVEAERAKVAAQAKAEEEARIAAKAAAKTKAAEDVRAAQQARTAAEKKAGEDAKAAEAERATAAVRARADEDARLAEAKAAARIAADKAKADEAKKAQDGKPVGQLAALTPPEQAGDATAKKDKPTPEDIPRLLETELRRVGCNTGAVDGNWSAAAQKSLGLFNRNAGTNLDTKVASFDALDVVRSKPARTCPLVCESGYKAEGDSCTRITCRAGYQLGDDNTCERIKAKKPAGREAPAAVAKPAPERPAVEKSTQTKSASSPEAMYAQCRVMASAKYVTRRGLFRAMERCVLNGGRL